MRKIRRVSESKRLEIKKSQIQFCEELYEKKGHSRFLLQTLVDQENSKDQPDKAKKSQYLTKLIEIDPIRTNYYNYLLSE